MYYCHTSHKTVLPNGVVETRKQTRTNEKEEREVCRQIGEQKVVEKVSRDLASGKEDKQRDLVNLKEEEAEAFAGKF